MNKQEHPSRSALSGQENPSSAILPEDPTLDELEIGSAIYRTRFTDKFRNRKTWQRPEPNKVITYIPGTIQKILVGEDAEVNQGEPILILEAMKMRNELLSPVHGVVKKIHVSEGDKVPKGQLLLEFRKD